jgi:hypothetical protein
MNIFPTIEKHFRLVDSQEKTLDRLKRRTEYSENLTSRKTEKSFRGKVTGQGFAVISSFLGWGAFCVMTGEIDSEQGIIRVNLHKVFKLLCGFILCLPIIGLVAILTIENKDSSIFLILISFLQMIVIRFVFIELSFRFISNSSLRRFKDVCDVEWTKV